MCHWYQNLNKVDSIATLWKDVETAVNLWFVIDIWPSKMKNHQSMSSSSWGTLCWAGIEGGAHVNVVYTIFCTFASREKALPIQPYN